MKKHSQKILYYFPPIVWALIIFTFSANKTGQVSEVRWQDFAFKKFVHICEYGIFTLLTYRALRNTTSFSKIRCGYISILISVLYAMSDEFHQSFTPGREPTIRDVIFDTIGSILSIYTLWNILPKAPKRLKNLAEKLQLT